MAQKAGQYKGRRLVRRTFRNPNQHSVNFTLKNEIQSHTLSVSLKTFHSHKFHFFGVWQGSRVQVLLEKSLTKYFIYIPYINTTLFGPISAVFIFPGDIISRLHHVQSGK